ncbi:hypothetical protein M409DRAFT_26473 [Zasmidium cellare ATCC 36951]|uniref:NmrA-like domain-containing protein n=1 Tax=Zasmidium cellare ATCC 36951 TaxID=1080233 RepID=A0A6A6CC52_ZASCE|nr:uncharacterized protein M409DRAFT_26473 [Zasmidium cellare ATCC 36951]KAF2163026.1 hypothetical protein M409DRAFT_26473 [Zasmidium cellare ATCC 36951]
MNRIQRVAIVGAGGRLGSFVIDELIASDLFTVTAIRRPESKSQLPPGIPEVEIVNYSDKSAVVDALRGQDALVITLNFFAAPESQKQLVDAAVEAGVKFIMPNEWAFPGADGKLGKDIGMGLGVVAHREYIESAITGKDTSWISITCGPWYEFSLVCGFDCSSSARFGFDFDAKTVTFFDHDGRSKIHTTTWNQVARGVLALLSLPIDSGMGHAGPSLSDFKNSSVHIASFLISQHDMFESILRLRGERVNGWTIEREDTQARFDRTSKMVGNEDKMINLEGMVTRMYTRFFWPDGSGTFSDKLANEQLSLPNKDLDDATAYALKLLGEKSVKLQL